MELPLLVLKVA